MVGKIGLITFGLTALFLNGSASCYAGLPDSLHDNSGRQIAVVVPGMPHPGLSILLPNNSNIATKHIAPLSCSTGAGSDFRGRVLTAVSTPTELSPEVKNAMEQGALAAHGLSSIAVKRAADLGIWISMLWREFNEVPRATPNSPALAPDLPVGMMRPLAEYSQGRFTAVVYVRAAHKIACLALGQYR